MKVGLIIGLVDESMIIELSNIWSVTNMTDVNKTIELNTNELASVSGGGMLWNEYAKYVLFILETGLNSPLVESTKCPYCGWKLELIKKAEVSTDEEEYAINKRLITCHGCGGRVPGDAWFQLKGERREVLR